MIRWYIKHHFFTARLQQNLKTKNNGKGGGEGNALKKRYVTMS